MNYSPTSFPQNSLRAAARRDNCRLRFRWPGVGITAIAIAIAFVQSLSAQENADTGPKNAPPAEKAAPPGETIDLLQGEFPERWQIFHSEPVAENVAVWKVLSEEPESILVCSGTPKGYLLTKQKYEEFELTLEWRYPADANGNSGVLVYTQNEPRIWPTSVQVQFHQPAAGSIFPTGDATTDNTLVADPGLARPVGMWNECRIVSKGGRLSVEINGRKVGEVTGAKPSSGGIALQSEGSEVQFRRVRLRDLRSVPEPKA